MNIFHSKMSDTQFLCNFQLLAFETRGLLIPLSLSFDLVYSYSKQVMCMCAYNTWVVLGFFFTLYRDRGGKER